MPHSGTDRRDFFISFNSANRDWAEWVASELEAAGYTTYFQDWDFAPGSNFVLEMQKAASQSDRTIAILSPAYLTALFTQPEWAAALVQDPTGSKRTLVPVRVQECLPGGILASIVYSDLVGLDEEAARAKLQKAVKEGWRPKPGSIAFPKSVGKAAGQRAFPKSAAASPGQVSPISPAANGTPKPPRAKPKHAWEFWLIWFALALVVAGLLIGFADRLAAFGLVNQIYYLVLVAVGLAAAGTLFVILHSQARYRGEGEWGVLELGSPVVVFVLVVGAGMWFSPGSRSFGLTVFVESPDGPLRQGRVALDLGADRRVEAIGEKGVAIFTGIPAEFRGREVMVSLEANGFERTERGPVKLAEDSVYVQVRKRASRLYGVVVNGRGYPVGRATVDAGGVKVVTGPNGRFDIEVTEPVLVRVLAEGFAAYSEYATPGANEMTVSLLAERKQ